MDHDHQNSSTYETIFTSLIFSTTIQPLRHCFLGTFQSQKRAFWAPGNASRIASNQTLLKSLSPVQQEHPATGKHRAMSGAVCKLPRLPSLKLTYPLKIGLPKRKLVFQPSIFRCYVSFREGIACKLKNFTQTSLLEAKSRHGTGTPWTIERVRHKPNCFVRVLK